MTKMSETSLGRANDFIPKMEESIGLEDWRLSLNIGQKFMRPGGGSRGKATRHRA